MSSCTSALLLLLDASSPGPAQISGKANPYELR
jgi:hypothetical protein